MLNGEVVVTIKMAQYATVIHIFYVPLSAYTKAKR